MKFKEYLNEGKIENNIQNIVNKICKEYKVDSIPIKFNSKYLEKGPAYYTSKRFRGSKIVTGVSITIGEWNAVKNYPDEWVYFLGHELAHHILAITRSTLCHSKKHELLAVKLTTEIKKFLNIKPKLSNKEKEKIQNKLDYWLDPNNKIELIHIHGQKIYDKEIRIMQDKLK